LSIDDRGTARNEAKAVDWWLKAADQGHAGAMVKLGEAYLEGSGLQPDRGEAARWLRLAAAQGDEDAKTILVAQGL
jgi:TPR repeat protein